MMRRYVVSTLAVVLVSGLACSLPPIIAGNAGEQSVPDESGPGEEPPSESTSRRRGEF